jgi:formylglycine-generating enzyme required for sulfatase activity
MDITNDKQDLYKDLSDNYIVINEGYHMVHLKVHYTTKVQQFAIMDTVVTQGQYVRKMGKNPSFFQDKKFNPDHYAMLEIDGKNIDILYDFPLENINWYEANEYAQALSKDDPDYNYRLPTDEELDIVYRAESKEEYFNNQDISTLKDYIWCVENSEGQTHPVRSKLPNHIGCYSSAVIEWTKSWSHCNGEPNPKVIDPYYHPSYFPIVRGYSFNCFSYRCKLNYRCMINPESKYNDVGFRLVRELKK